MEANEPALKPNLAPLPEEEETYPIDVAIEKWHAALNASQLLLIKQGAKDLASQGVITFGSGFSGCDIYVKVLQRLVRFWKREFGIAVRAKLLFACGKM